MSGPTVLWWQSVRLLLMTVYWLVVKLCDVLKTINSFTFISFYILCCNFQKIFAVLDVKYTTVIMYHSSGIIEIAHLFTDFLIEHTPIHHVSRQPHPYEIPY